MSRCWCPCHAHPATYPPPCSYCGHDDRLGRMPGGIRDGWEPDPPKALDARVVRALDLAERHLRTCAWQGDPDAEAALAQIATIRRD